MARLRLVPLDTRYHEGFVAFLDDLGAEGVGYKEFWVYDEDDDFDAYVALLRGTSSQH